MKHPCILAFFLLLASFTVLHGQLREQSMQHFPYSHLQFAEPVSDGYILAFNPNPWGGPVLIQKIDMKGDEIWTFEHRFNKTKSFIMDLLVLDNEDCLVSIVDVCGFFCPDYYESIYHLSSQGEVLTRNFPQSIYSTVGGALQTLTDEEAFPLMTYSKPVMNSSGGAGFFRIDSAQDCFPKHIPYLYFSGPPFFHKDLRSRFLIPVHHGVGVLAPLTGEITETIYVGTSPVQMVIEAPDSTLLIVHHEAIVHITLDGEVLDSRAFAGSKLWKAQIVEDYLYLFDRRDSKDELLWMLQKENFEVIDVLSSFTDGTTFSGVLPGDGEHYVWGNERHNAFIKPITLSGEYEPFTTDVTLLDFQVEDVHVSTIKHHGADATQVHFVGMKALINNTGIDTLREVVINLPVDLKTNLQYNYNWPQEWPSKKVRVRNFQVFPGHSFWLDAGDLIFIAAPAPAGFQISIDFCVELSCPNNRIDAVDANDSVCKEFNLTLSSVVAEVGPLSELRVSPNPFSNRLHLQGLPPESRQAELYDALGREVARMPLDGSPEAFMEAPTQNSGAHYLIIRDKEGRLRSTLPLMRAE